MQLLMVHLELVNFSIEDMNKTPTTHLSNKACKKKNGKKCTSCGSLELANLP
jgi:hypothetical protein